MQQVAQMREVVTIGTLAVKLGVAKSTVSRALRGDPRISQATRKRVEECARDQGFEPHPYVQTLMTQRRMQRQVQAQANLVYVNDYKSKADFAQRPLAKATFEAARERAAEKGWSLELESLAGDDADGLALSRRLRRRGVLGVILGRTLALRIGIPTGLLQMALVSDSRYWIGAGLDRVGANGLEMLSRLMVRLLEQGSKKVGLFFPQHLILPETGSIHELIRFMNLCGSKLVVLEPGIASEVELRHAIATHRIDSLLFHHREKRPWLVKMLGEGGFDGQIAEYSPPTADSLPWMSAIIPAREIGVTLADVIIEKVCRSDTGISALERVIVFPGILREGEGRETPTLV